MRRIATTLAALGFVWAVATTVYLLTSATYEGVSTGAAVLGADEVGAARVDVSLVSANGPWIVGLFAGVSLLAGLPFGIAVTLPDAQRVATVSAGILLLAFSVLSGFTVGLFYAPSALLLLLSALLAPPPDREPTQRRPWGRGAG